MNDLLQQIDPSKIADVEMRQTIEILLNLIEELNSKVKNLQAENQRLRDENNRLKGEQGKPDIKPNINKGFSKDISSEKERKTPTKHSKSSKKPNIKIDRIEILEYPIQELPPDAQFKGYEEVIIQDISLHTDNVLFRKQKYYSPQTGKTYLASLPVGYDGEFGPGIKALVISLYYGGNMTQGKLLEFLENIGVSMSAGYLSNLLIKEHSEFETELNELYIQGLASTEWQHFDQTSARVKGVNYTTNVVCNPLYTLYSTTEKKDRLTVLGVLQNDQQLKFILNPLTYALLDSLHLPVKWSNQIKLLPQETVFTESEFNSLLHTYLSNLGSQNRTRVLEAAAIAFYHQQDIVPVIQTLVCDDAPQFKLLTSNLALCWVHEARHYKKLSPMVACHQIILDNFLDEFWVYYRQLLAYRDSPDEKTKLELKARFWEMFSTETGYGQLDQRKQLTLAKAPELLLVLEYPILPLHNNPAELAARTIVQRRSISYGTQTSEGTKAWDIFMSLVATTRKLGISFFEYIQDRISHKNIIPNLGSVISHNCFVEIQLVSQPEAFLCQTG